MTERVDTPPQSPRRWRLWGLAGLVFVVSSAVLGIQFFWPAWQYATAEAAFQRHDWATARARLDQYRTRWPHDARAWLLAARAARQAEDFADAERLLTEYENRFRSTEASRLEWSLLGAQQGDLVGCEDWLPSRAERDPVEKYGILEALARGYHVSWRWPEAAPFLDQVIEHSPGYAAPLLLRGTLYLRFYGKSKMAIVEEDFRRAVAAEPSNASAHAALAGILNDEGHSHEAILEYERSLRLRPGDPKTVLGLARALMDIAALSEAQERLDELLQSIPNHVEGLVERGRLALRRERFAEAKSYLARAIEAAPWNRVASQLNLIALQELGLSAEASRCEAHLAELAAEDAQGGRLKRHFLVQQDVSVAWNLYQWSMRNGERELGFVWLMRVMQLDPQHGPGHMALADHFEQAGQPRRAARHRSASRP